MTPLHNKNVLILLTIAALAMIFACSDDSSRSDDSNDDPCKNGCDIPIPDPDGSCNAFGSGWVKCDGTCIDPMTSNLYCGANAYCEGYEICAPGTTCEFGKCVELPPVFYDCPEGEFYFDGICEPESVEHCGGHGYNCAENFEGWQDGECSGGQCYVTECSEDYFLYFYEFGDVGGWYLCELNSIHQCGALDYNCEVAIEGWLTGECINGQCSASDCADDYHLYSYDDERPELNRCERNSVEHCGEHGYNCAEAIEGWQDGECIAGSCYARECFDNYHLFGDRCERDNEFHCGSHDNSCFFDYGNRSCLFEGAESCYCSEGECRISTCAAGYYYDKGV